MSKKTLNIIEAREANRTHAVKDPRGAVWDVTELTENTGDFTTSFVFGAWTIVQKPREVYIVFTASGEIGEVLKAEHVTLGAAEGYGMDVRKFREVLDEG
jgi:hypothetical protein